MTQPLMPQRSRRRRGESLVVWEPEWVEITAALTSEHLRPGRKVLNGKTKRVKFNRNIIITGKTANRN
jgi:hypothetical protein